MTGPGQPQTCSHPINTWTLTGVRQAVKMFCQFQLYVSIETLDSDISNSNTTTYQTLLGHHITGTARSTLMFVVAEILIIPLNVCSG